MFGSPGSRIGRGQRGYTTLYFDTQGNIIAGEGAGEGFARGGGLAPSAVGQSIMIGTMAGNRLNGSDFGNVMVGRYAGALNSFGSTGYNTCIGDGAGYNGFATTTFVSYGACIALGRAAGAGWTTDTYCLAAGHAAMFKGGGNQGVVAIGDSAAGANIDGTSTNWQGTGLTYWGAISDVNCSYIGRYTGKSSAATRTNSHAIGYEARLPLKDNTMVLGHGLTAVQTAGRVWEGMTSVTVNSNVGVTLTAAQMLTGIINRTGTFGGTITDTTDTAANIVAAGPGLNCEVPCSIEMNISNNGTGNVLTIGAGTGVTLAGVGSGISNNLQETWRIIVTNSTSGSEAVTLYRIAP